MRSFLQIILGFFLLLLFIGSIAFTLANTWPVPLSLGFISFAPQAVSLWVLLAFCLGALTGLVVGSAMFRGIRTGRRLRRLQQKLDQREAELARFTQAPVRRPTPLLTHSTQSTETS